MQSVIVEVFKMSVAKSSYPKKLFYKINEVSRITGIKAYVLRYWESEFDQLKPQKDVNDQRRYRKKDIDTITNIKQLLYEDRFTIAGAKKKLKKPSVTGTEKKTGKRKMQTVKKELGSIRNELNALLELYA
jgi:DNA-binding transcriptional MerR regulator